MVDIELVKKELIPPEIYLCFSANYEKRGSKKKYYYCDVYAMNACTGDVYKADDAPPVSADMRYYWGLYRPNNLPAKSQYANNNFYCEYYDTIFSLDTNKTYTYLLEWQYIPKYDVVALIQWTTPNIPFNPQRHRYGCEDKSIKITDCPNIGIVSKDKDPNAIFRWELDTNTIDVMAMIVIDKERNVEYKNFFGHELDCVMSKKCLSDRKLHWKSCNWNVLKKYFGIVFLGDNIYDTIHSQSELGMFLRAKDPKYVSGPKQKKLDELLNIPLKNPETDLQVSSSYCYVSRVNDKWAVIRWFKFKEEVYRLYVSKTEHLFCRSNLEKKFVLFNGKLKPDTLQANKVFFENEDVLKNTKLQYLPKLDSYVSKAIYMFVNYPEFEKFLKSGLSELCLNYLQCGGGTTWNLYLKEMLGTVDVKARGLNQIVGLNKHQIEKLPPLRFGKWEAKIVKDLKSIFGMDDLRDLDDQSFDAVVDLYMEQDNWEKTRETLENAKSLYSYRVMIKVATDMRRLLKEEGYSPSERFWRWSNSICFLYNDTLSMIKFLNMADRIKPYFKNKEELKNAHDVLIDAVNHVKYSASIEKFDGRKKIWKRWEYTENSEYVVIAPKRATEIAEEGIELHHCVRSYIPDVVEGKTNIMFIREKGKENVPFFTAEVLNDGKIRQIHGLCNCNVSSVDGLSDFVKEWANAVGVQINSYDQCLCA